MSGLQIIVRYCNQILLIKCFLVKLQMDQYSYLLSEKTKSDINIEIPDWLYGLELALKNN
jgi:hypothetical protein